MKGTYHDYGMSSLELDRVQIVQLGWSEGNAAVSRVIKERGGLVGSRAKTACMCTWKLLAACFGCGA